MTPPADPYRTLGLGRGASLAEVKRAYRALAKVNHPDAAGPGALPRFLAIQAAYEQLLRAAAAKGPVARGAPKPPSRASEADPDRAEATRRAYGGRSRRTRPTAPGGSTGTSAGSRPRPEHERATGNGAGASGAADGTDDHDGPNKATLGSTSYDGADAQPFEPDWGGASWYGTTSGTYWTINPKEYADPRKHGPEYQARARRAARTRARTGTLGSVPDPASPAEAANPDEPIGPAADTATDPAAEPAGTTHTTATWWESTTGGPVAADRPSERERAARERSARERDAATDIPPPDLAAAAADLGRAITDERTARGRWRLVQAVVGWLPIAFGLGWLIGEATGCGRFAASCDGAASMLTPLLALISLVVLLVIPTLAALAATAAVGALVAAVPTALLLSAGGAAVEPESRSAALGIVLVVAWVAGLAFAVLRRIRSGGASPG